jgi:uncharacterized protein
MPEQYDGRECHFRGTEDALDCGGNLAGAARGHPASRPFARRWLLLQYSWLPIPSQASCPHSRHPMKPSESLLIHRQEIRRVVEQNRGCNPRVFGSVLHGSDRDGSDLDLLIDPTSDTTLMDIARIQNRLQKLLGIPVDVLTPKALPATFRAAILAEARAV